MAFELTEEQVQAARMIQLSNGKPYRMYFDDESGILWMQFWRLDESPKDYFLNQEGKRIIWREAAQ